EICEFGPKVRAEPRRRRSALDCVHSPSFRIARSYTCAGARTYASGRGDEARGFSPSLDCGQRLRADVHEHARVDVEQKALEGEPPGGDLLGDPGKGHEVVQRQADDVGLDPGKAPLLSLARRLDRGAAELDPRGDEVAR